MNSNQGLDIEFRKNSSSKLIVYDLALKQKMYNIPKKIINNISSNFHIKLEPINCPNLKRFNSDAEIYWGNRIDKDMLEMMPNLRWVHFGSVGINRLNNVKKKNLIITSSKGLVSESMISHTISLLGLFSRRLDIFFEKKKDQFTRNDYDLYFSELKNFNELKILIIGLGNIGEKLAEKLFYLGCKIDGISKNKKINKFVENHFSFKESYPNLKKYDFVISLLPENIETLKLLNFNFFSNLNPRCTLINIGRGTTINEGDLIRALDKKLFKRAILDVTAIEPLPKDSIMNKHPRIFLTPHIASFSPSYWPLQEKLFAHNLGCYLSKNIDQMINIEYASSY